MIDINLNIAFFFVIHCSGQLEALRDVKGRGFRVSFYQLECSPSRLETTSHRHPQERRLAGWFLPSARPLQPATVSFLILMNHNHGGLKEQKESYLGQPVRQDQATW